MPDSSRVVKVSLVAQVSNYVAGLQEASRATSKMSDEAKRKLEAQQKVMGGVGKAALAMGAVAAAGVVLAIKKFADFDAEMATVRTLAHATSGEMKQLRDAALEMGQGIGFSATQVAEAEQELVKAGISVKDIMGGALKGALDLAAAGQIDVGEATQYAAEAMTQFKLKGKDVPHIADLLAAGADKALGGVDDLGQALESGGLVAHQFGVSIEQTVGTLAAFAQAGITGERGGTTFRQMLLKLAAPSAEADKLLKKYNITLYDSQGQFVGVSKLAKELKNNLGGLDDATRNAALATIFGARAIKGANVLYQEGAKGIKDWTKKVDDSGFASEQASGKMDSLEGDVKKLAAAFDTDLIKSGSAANGILRDMVQGLTGLLHAFGDAPQPVQAATLVLGGVTSAITLAGGAALLAVPKVVAFNAALDTMATTAPRATRAVRALVAAAKFGPLIGGSIAAAKGIDALVHQANIGVAQVAHLTATTNQWSEAIRKGDIDVHHLGLHLASTSGFWNDFIHNTKLGGGAAASSYDQMKKLDQALAEASPEDLTKAYGQLVEKAKSLGLTATDVANRFPLATAALQKQKDAAEKSESATKKDSTALAELSGTAVDASGSVNDLADAIQNFGKGALDVDDAERQFQQALDDASDSISKNGATLDLNTQQGRDNDAALTQIARSTLGLVAAQVQANASQDTLTGTMAQGRAAFIKAAEAAGLTAQQAQTLADKYGLIPKNVGTAVNATDNASPKVEAVKKLLDSIDGKTSTVYVDFYESLKSAPYQVLPPDLRKASGGILPGAPSSRDNMLIAAASGEFITKASQAAIPANRRALEYMNRGGVIPGFADGGVVRPIQYAQPSGRGSGGGFGPVSLNMTGAKLKLQVGGREFDAYVQSQAGVVVSSEFEQQEQRRRMGARL